MAMRSGPGRKPPVFSGLRNSPVLPSGDPHDRVERSTYNRVASFPHSQQKTHIAAGKHPPAGCPIKDNLAYDRHFEPVEGRIMFARTRYAPA